MVIGLVEYVRPSEWVRWLTFRDKKEFVVRGQWWMVMMDGAKPHASLGAKKNQTVKEQLKQLVTDCMHSLTKQA